MKHGSDKKESLITRRSLLTGAVALSAPFLFRNGFTFQSDEAEVISVGSEKIGEIGPRFMGLSYEKGVLSEPLFRKDNQQLIELFQGIGPLQLRIGGNSVDKTHWNPNGKGRTAFETAPSDIRELSNFARASNTTVLYGVNLATSTPEAAADEVAYAVSTLGSSLDGIEIGNECDLYKKHYFPVWKLSDFEARWELFREAILKKSPHVKITGPASATRIEKWTIPFGKYVGKQQIDLLTQHYYRGSGKSASSTYQKLISPDENLVHQLKELRDGAREIGIPFRISETNSFYSGGRSGVSDSFASALWVIDHLFTIAIGGSIGVNLHGGGNGPGYTPIANNKAGEVVKARPEYYGLLIFHHLGTGTILRTTGGSDDLSAYSVNNDQGLNIALVNKQSVAASLILDLPGHSGKHLSGILLTGDGLESTSGCRIGSQGINGQGSQFHGSLDGLIQTTQSNNINSNLRNGRAAIKLPAYSAAALILN